jgi:hypothetical protein
MTTVRNLVGISEIAKAMGVSRQRVHQLAVADWWPLPITTIGKAHVYDMEEVREALKGRGRVI